MTSGLSQLCPVMRGDDLCVYRNVNNGIGDGNHACLYYFTPGQKSAVRIPLEFTVLPGLDNTGFTRMQAIIFRISKRPIHRPMASSFTMSLEDSGLCRGAISTRIAREWNTK